MFYKTRNVFSLSGLLLALLPLFVLYAPSAAALTEVRATESLGTSGISLQAPDEANIIVTLNPDTSLVVPPPSLEIRFTDSNPGDGRRRYEVQGGGTCQADTGKKSELWLENNDFSQPTLNILDEGGQIASFIWLQPVGSSGCAKYLIPPGTSIANNTAAADGGGETFYLTGDNTITSASGAQTFVSGVTGYAANEFVLQNDGDCPAIITVSGFPGEQSVYTGTNQNRKGSPPCEDDGGGFSITVIANEEEFPPGFLEEIEGLDGFTDFEPTCDSEVQAVGEVLAWIGCAALATADRGLTAFDNKLDGLLKVERDEYDIPGYREAWSNVRNISTMAVVGTALFMVISTALDMGFFANYTVKKYLPRLVIGTIAIQLSWVVASLIMVFANELGDGLQAILFAPFPGANDISLEAIAGGGPGDVFAGVGAGIGVGVAVSMGLFGALAAAYSGLVFLFFGYIFLVFRELILITLIIFSPLGVALWILPGSDNAWNTYRRTFTALVWMYPVIAAVVAAGKIFAHITITGDPGT